MKKSIALLLACIMAGSAFAADRTSDDRFSKPENRHIAKSGYRALVTIDDGITALDENIELAPYVGITTTHGYQIFHYLFVGAGCGINMAIAPKVTLVRIPIFAEVRTNAGKRLAQFTSGVRFGIYLTPEPVLPEEDSYMQFYSQVDCGLRLGFTPKFALQITPFIALSNYRRENKNRNGHSEFESLCLFDAGLRVAFEF